MKNKFFKLVCWSTLVIGGVSSCVKPVTLPDKFSYDVKVSDDMLNLFDISANYISPQKGKQTKQIKTGSWSEQFYQTEGFTARLDIRMTAKNGARDGSLLSKDSYDMGLTYRIITGEEIPSKTMTRAAMTSDSKASDFRKFSFKVPMGQGVKSDDITVEMPRLKYDKHFVFCFTVDDSNENGWSRMFAALNGRWIDDQEFFHLGASRSRGTQDEPLCITDGCGGDRNFTFGEAIWPNLGNSYNPNGFIQNSVTSTYNPYVSWEELDIMTDLGNAVYWHDVDTVKHDKHAVENLVLGFQEDYDKTLSKTGYHMKTMAQPNGEKLYLEAAMASPLVCVARGTQDFEEVPVLECQSLYKKNVFGGDCPGTYKGKLEELARQAASDSPKLVSMLDHRPQNGCLEMFRTIYSLYGKAGADNIWVTTYDELYEYFEMRQSVEISERVEGGYKVFEVTIPSFADFHYSELSFVIRGASGAAVRISDNLCGFSSAVREDGTVLVNCNSDSRALDLAEKYTTLYERTMAAEYKSDAEYLISLLREDLRPSLLTRLAAVHEPTRADYPLNGKYENWQMKHYIMLYDGLKDTVSVSF